MAGSISLCISVRLLAGVAGKLGAAAGAGFPALAVEFGGRGRLHVLTICVPTLKLAVMSERLREEIRQGRPFQTLEQEAYLEVVRTASALSDRLERVLEPAGITLAQYNVLRILRGSHDDGLCRNDLRDRMLTRMPDVTRLLDRMEAAGWVRRTRDTEDRRMVNTRITEEGLQLLDAVQEAVAAEHARAFGHVGKGRLKTLIDLLSEVRQDD
jgi:DNA-binding MarR family transcriptional regulator